MSDNFSFRMSSEGDLKPIIELVMRHSGRWCKIAGYAIRPAQKVELYDVEPDVEVEWPLQVRVKALAKPERIVFYWSTSSKADFQCLPFDIDANMAAEIAKNWLEQTAKYGNEPDHDGDNHRGWTVYNEAWGHVDGEYQAFMAISPTWMMYGK